MTSGLPGNAHVDQRLLEARAETAYVRQHDINAAAFDGLGEGVVQALCAVAAAARSHAHGDARNRRHQLGEPASRTALKAPMSWMRGITHSPVPCVRTSRCSVRSFTWPQMR